MFLRIIFGLMLTVSCASLQSQTWLPMGNGLPQPPTPVDSIYMMTSTTGNGKLYLGYTKAASTSQGSPFHWEFLEWDGFAWNDLTPQYGFASYPMNATRITAMNYFQGHLWMSGFLDRPFFKFDGRRWGATYTWNSGNYLNSMENIGNRMYGVGKGDFYLSNPFLAISDAFYIEDTSFHALPKMPSLYTGFNSVFRHQGDIYVTGRELASFQTEGILKLDTVNQQWVDPINYVNSTFNRGNSEFYNGVWAFQYDGKVYLHNGSAQPKIFRMDHDSLIYVARLEHNINDAVTLNNKVYLVGDKNSSAAGSEHYLSVFDGQQAFPVFNAPTHLKAAEIYNKQLCVFSDRMDTLNGRYYQKAFRTSGDIPLKTILTYVDENGNCQFDSNERRVPHAVVNIAGRRLSTNTEGVGNLAFSAGKYSLDSCFALNSIYQDLQKQCVYPDSLLFDSIWDTTYIAFYNPVQHDLALNLYDYTGWRARRGFTELYNLELSNLGRDSAGTYRLEIDLPQGVSYRGGSPAPGSTSGNRLIYNDSGLEAYQRRSYILRLKVDTSNALNDTLAFRALVKYASDSIPQNDSTSLKQRVTAGFDPNDKLVDQELIYAPGELNYRIRFQNTGNDTAYNVTVIDTVNSSLNLNSIRMNSSSHGYQFSLDENVLKWKFNDIRLPDSTTDLLNSQGYVDFSIHTSPNLSPGDSATNKAGIYFDFAKPVITNMALTKLTTNVSVDETFPAEVEYLELFPNPSEHWFYLKNNQPSSVEVTMRNMRGVVIARYHLQPMEQKRISTASLQTGVYILGSSEGSICKLIKR